MSAAGDLRRCRWTLHNTTAVSPDRVERCNLHDHRIIPAAVIHFTSFLFPIPLCEILVLPSSSQWYNISPGSYSGLPSLIPATVPPVILMRKKISVYFPRLIASICTYPRMLDRVKLYLKTHSTRFVARLMGPSACGHIYPIEI